MADRGFEQDEDLPPLWQKQGLTYMKTFLHYDRQRVWVIWRFVSIIADSGFELYEDLSPLWQTEWLSYIKTCLHYGRQRVWARWRFASIMAETGFDLYEDFSPLWQAEFELWRVIWSLTYLKTFLHYGRQRVWLIWRLFSIMADRGFSKMKTYLYYGRKRVWVIWTDGRHWVWVIGTLFSIMAGRRCELYESLSPLWQAEGLSYMNICLHYRR